MKIIFFDFDGVIVDSFSICYEISNMISPSSEDSYKSMYEGNIYKALATRVNARPDIDFFDEYAPRLAEREPIEEMASIIRELSKEHMLIIVSSTTSSIIKGFLEKHGMADAFEDVLGNDIERSKVKKIRMMLDKYAVKPEDTLFVTDTLGDILEGAECSVKSIGVTWGFHAEETLAKGMPFRIVSQRDDIAKAVREYFS